MSGVSLELVEFTSLFPIILLGFIAAVVTSPILRKIASRANLVDIPGSSRHKTHAAATPMAGGMVIALSLMVCAIWFKWLTSTQILGILIASGIVFGFGLWDDIKGLGAPRKLFGQGLAAAALIVTGTHIQLFSSAAANLALTVLWVVGVVNAFNFVDSKDGLAVGIAAVGAAFFMLVAVESGQLELSALSAAILGVGIGLYLFNVMPARIFLGDSGSQQLGLLLAAIGVAYNPVGLERLTSWFVPILVLSVPIFDMTLVVISRLRGRRPVYRAGHDHTFHKLAKLGLEPTQAVAVMHTAAIITGVIAFIALGTGVLLANSIFVASILAGLGMIVFLEVRAAP